MKNWLISLGLIGFLFMGFSISCLGQEISRLKADYLFNLDNYRLKEDQFIKTRKNFYNLKNLASKIQALTAEREFLLARNEVLKTYFVLLKAVLLSSQVQGIDIRSIEGHLENTILNLEQEIETIQGLESIEELNQASGRVEEKKDYFYHLSSLIAEMIYFNKLSVYFSRQKDISQEVIERLRDKIGEEGKEFARYQKEIEINNKNLSSLWLDLYQQLSASTAEEDLSFYRGKKGVISSQMEEFKKSLLSLVRLNNDILKVLENE